MRSDRGPPALHISTSRGISEIELEITRLKWIIGCYIRFEMKTPTKHGVKTSSQPESSGPCIQPTTDYGDLDKPPTSQLYIDPIYPIVSIVKLFYPNLL
jgi:hypothetical protein